MAMLSDSQRDYIRKVTRTIQIIVGAMAAGVLAFLGIVFYLVSRNPNAAVPAEPIVTYLAIGMALVTVIASLIVPGIVASRMRQSLVDGRSSQWGLVQNVPRAAELGDVTALAVIYQTRTIIGTALLEGSAFLASVAYLLEHQRYAAYVASVLLLLLLGQIPTTARIEAWMEGESAMIQQMRQMR
jgi:hypothetical protein